MLCPIQVGNAYASCVVKMTAFNKAWGVVKEKTHPKFQQEAHRKKMKKLEKDHPRGCDCGGCTESNQPDWVTCGGCGKHWDDSVSTATTPPPSALCPFCHGGEEA